LGLAGHHIIPRQIFENMGFSTEVVKFFNKQTTGAIPGGHGWSKAHSEYNAAVKKFVKNYLKKNNIKAACMTLDEAMDLLKRVKRSKAKAIKAFLWGIKQAQINGTKVSYLGLGIVGYTSLDAAFRADPIETLHLISVGDL
jgi:predicted RND superfamily exporter protein